LLKLFGAEQFNLHVEPQYVTAAVMDRLGLIYKNICRVHVVILAGDIYILAALRVRALK